MRADKPEFTEEKLLSHPDPEDQQTHPAGATPGTGAVANSVSSIAHPTTIASAGPVPTSTVPTAAIQVAPLPLQVVAQQQFPPLTDLPLELVAHIHTMLDQDSRQALEIALGSANRLPVDHRKLRERHFHRALTALLRGNVGEKSHEEQASLLRNVRSFFRDFSKSEIRQFLLGVLSSREAEQLQHNFEAIANVDPVLAINLITTLSHQDLAQYGLSDHFLAERFQAEDWEMDEGEGRLFLDQLRQSPQSSALHFAMQREIEGEVDQAQAEAETKVEYLNIAHSLAGVEGEDNINGFDTEGRTLLMYAVDHNNHTIVQLLADDWNANMNIQDRHGNTALMRAVINQNIDMVQYLLDLSTIKLEHNRNMGISSRNNQAALIDLNVRDSQGNTALMLAVRSGNIEMVRLLLENDFGRFQQIPGVELNMQNNSGNTALMLAVRGRNSKMVKELLKHQVDLTLQDHEGSTVLDLAQPNSELIILLQQADPASYEARRESLFSSLMQAVREGKPREVEALFFKDREIFNKQDESGNTALMYAVMLQNAQIVQLLLTLNVDHTLINHDQQTALQLAEALENEAIKTLLQAIK
jgi:ankyrin repeat protein